MVKKLNNYKILKDYSIIYVLRKGEQLEVKVDTEDLQKIISVGSWHAIIDETLQTRGYYLCHRYNNKLQGAGCIKMHRLIMNCPRDKFIDHINHDTLDNRKQNLRIVTAFQNQQNLRSKKSEQTGVFKRIRFNREFWVANITKNKKRYTKDFKTKEEAIEWRLNKMKELYGEVV